MIETQRAVPVTAPVRSGARVLVVEDDPDVGAVVASVLSEEGYSTHLVTDPRQAIETFEHIRPDIVTLDVMMPNVDGLTLCLEMRRISDVPVLFISAKGEPPDRTVGLRLGADDYIGKPFDTEELVARVNALVRRAAPLREPQTPRELRFGSFMIDLGSVRAIADGEMLQLTPTEFKLLRHFMANPGRVLTQEEILEGVWGYDADVGGDLVKLNVSRLRRKLTQDGKSREVIQTVPGVGYLFRGAEGGVTREEARPKTGV